MADLLFFAWYEYGIRRRAVGSNCRIASAPSVRDESWYGVQEESRAKTVSAKKAVSRVRNAQPRKAGPRKTTDILDLVREGVERFILKDASIGDFQRAVLAAARKGEQSHHPVSGPVFRRIVKRAIQERKRRIKRARRP